MWYFCLDFQKRIYLILYFFYWPPGWKRLQPWTCTNVLFLSYMQKEKAFSPLKQYWRNRAKIFPIQTVSDLSMVWLMISDFIRVPKQYTFSRNYTSKFEFQSFPRLAACGTIFSCDAGQCWWAQLPVSFMITNRRVNNPYTYSHSVFFFFFWICHLAYGILVPWPGIKPCLLHCKCGVLITGPPRKSPAILFFTFRVEFANFYEIFNTVYYKIGFVLDDFVQL